MPCASHRIPDAMICMACGVKYMTYIAKRMVFFTKRIILSQNDELLELMVADEKYSISIGNHIFI